MSVDDDHLAHDLATEAGRRLLRLRSHADFSDQATLRAAGDRLSHEYLTAALAEHRRGDALLSEEGKDDPVRLFARRVWIVDPLDGTREFGEEGRTDWAVHVALWERAELAADERAADERPPREGTSGGPGPPGRLTAGAVALPAQGQTFSTVGDGPAAAGGAPGRAKPRLVVSRTRPPGFALRVAVEIGADVITLGSAGAKIMAVVTGAADAYVHAGGQYEWDSAAPVAVAQAAGLHASRIDGRPLRYNQPDPRLPDILVCQPALAERLLDAIRVADGVDAPVPGSAAAASDPPLTSGMT